MLRLELDKTDEEEQSLLEEMPHKPEVPPKQFGCS